MAYEYSVRFLWQGNIEVEQERMADWLEAHGEDVVCGFSSDGTGSVTLSTIARVSELAQDLGVKVIEVKYIEEVWDAETAEAETPVEA